MRFVPTQLEGAWIVEPERHSDSRRDGDAHDTVITPVEHTLLTEVKGFGGAQQER